jgi:hypothetical protein
MDRGDAGWFIRSALAGSSASILCVSAVSSVAAPCFSNH